MRRRDGLRVLKAGLLLTLVLGQSPCWAKCALASYTFIGRVMAESGEAVAGARVLVFVDEETLPLSRWHPEEPRSAVGTSAEGVFEVSGRVSTFSGYSFLTGDRCKRRVSRVEVVVLAEGFFPKRVTLKRREFAMKETDILTYSVELPELITLRREDAA